LRGRRLFPQKDVSSTWSHSPSRNPNLHLHRHYSASQRQSTFLSHDHSLSKSNSQIFPEQFREEFGNRMARSGPIVPSLPATNPNVRAAAAAPGAYYGGLSSSLSPIAFSSASSNASLPARSSSSNNNANPPHFQSSMDDPSSRAQYAPRTRDRQSNYEPEEQQMNNSGEGNPRRDGNGTGGRPEQLSSPTVSNSSTTSSTSSMLSQRGGIFASSESSNSPRCEYPVTASSQSPVHMTRMHPHTRPLIHNPVTSTHAHGTKSTFVPVPESTAYYENENENVRGYDGGHQDGQDEYEYHRYASGGGPVYVHQQPLQFAATAADPVQYSVPAYIRDHPPSSLPMTASDWAPLSARAPHPQQQNIMAPVPSESAADSRYAYSYHDHHTHVQW
jgi:hypothetical protein